jgi:gas vesicle protein GvpN
VLLGVLEERILVLPNASNKDSYLRVHPEFRAIFTSNPQEYAGVHSAQDALSDRLVTMDVDYYDRDTEIAIAAARSGLAVEQVYRIVDLVRDFRASGGYDQAPTLRACIIIGKVTARQGIIPSARDPRFVNICLDVLDSKTAFNSTSRDRREQQRMLLRNLIERHCAQ